MSCSESRLADPWTLLVKQVFGRYQVSTIIFIFA